PYIAGSVTPHIPDITAGIHNAFIFLSFNLKYIAATTAVCAKDGANAPTNIVSNPIVIIFDIAIGINPQCNPKITSPCQNNPTNTQHKIGEKLYNAKNKFPTILAPNVAIGPTIINPNGNETNKTAIGTKKFFTTSGIILVNIFSNLDAK